MEQSIDKPQQIPIAAILHGCFAPCRKRGVHFAIYTAQQEYGIRELRQHYTLEVISHKKN